MKLLCLLVLLQLGVTIRAAEITAVLFDGNAPNDDIQIRVAIRNDSASTLNFRLKTAAGAVGASSTLSVAPFATLGIPKAGPIASIKPFGVAPATLAPGAIGYFDLEFALGCAGNFTASTDTWSVAFPFVWKKSTDALWSEGEVITRTASVESRFWLWASYGTSPNPYTWGAVVPFTGAAPSFGHVDVTAPRDGHLKVMIGGAVKFDGQVVAGQKINWDTTDPVPYDGQEIAVWFDGVWYIQNVLIENMRATTINPETGLPEGGYEFTYHLAFTADGQPDPDEAPKTSDAPDKSTAPPNTAPGQYSGRDVPGKGPEASTNTSAPDTVQESYEATRQAVEDALNGNAGIGGPDGSGNVPDISLGDGATKGGTLGAGLGGGFSSVAGVAGFSVPGAGSLGSVTIDSFQLPFLFGSSISIGVPPWASTVYWLILVLTTFQTLLFLVRAARSAFSTAS